MKRLLALACACLLLSAAVCGHAEVGLITYYEALEMFENSTWPGTTPESVPEASKILQTTVWETPTAAPTPAPTPQATLIVPTTVWESLTAPAEEATQAPAIESTPATIDASGILDHFLMEQTKWAEPEPVVVDSFVVGTASTLSGSFFTDMWGNNSADIDVRALVHGYSPIVWTKQSKYEVNPQVVYALSSADYDDGNRIYMIALQEGLYYNDGTPITARDYAFSLLLYNSPFIAELGGNLTSTAYIAGADAYRQGAAQTLAGVRLLDELTFTIEIDADYIDYYFEPSLLDVCPYPIAAIAPGCEVYDGGDGVGIRNINSILVEPVFSAALLRRTILDPDTGYLSHPKVSAGPYRLESFDRDTRVAEFSLNAHYKGTYDRVKPTISRVVYQSVTPERGIEMLEAGEIQLLNKVSSGDAIERGLRLTLSKKAASRNYPRMGFGFVSFSCERGPLQSAAVRKAIAHCLDVEAFCEGYSPYAVPVYGYMGIGQWMYLAATGDFVPTSATTQAEIDAWDELSLDGLNTYPMDLVLARQLLVDDGWVLNESGGPFVEGSDSLRFKRDNAGALVPLSLKWALPRDTAGAQLLASMLPEAMESIGFAVEITELTFPQMLAQYYRQEERVYDMLYLATNFGSVFDPYFAFNTDEAFQGTLNTTGLRDEKLEGLALSLRNTPPGAQLEFCRKWLDFQTYWNETLPMLPLYSNLYFDFHTSGLQNYRPDAMMNWPTALLYAYMGQ